MSAQQVSAPAPAGERWLKVHPEATSRTGLSRTTLYGFMDVGRLRSIKVGGARRIPESALNEFMASFNGNGDVE